MSEENGNSEKSFNDAELQDIMNEIESLEKEFVEEGGVEPTAEEPEASSEPQETETPAAQEAEPEAETETVQASEESDDSDEGEDKDLVSEAETYEEEQPQPQAEVEVETDNVVAMPSQKVEKPAATAPTGEGYMQFSGQGDMDMQLNFQLGSETATVNISGGSLNVTLAGVELQLTENGCEVNMEGGVKFSVPLTGAAGQGKKAA